MRIDAHQHFWHYSPTEHVWMTDAMVQLKRDFMPPDLRPLLDAVGIDGCVAVQARQNLDETRVLLALADEYSFIRGVVGWVDLCSAELPAQLEQFAPHPKLVGVRHVVHDEPDDDFMLRADFRRGIGQLKPFNLTYDLLLFPNHLSRAVRLVREFPGQPFVLDHIAKPLIAAGQLEPWATHMRELGRRENVWCKLSGMVTEADWRTDPARASLLATLKPYLDVAVEAFGPVRLMAGSDWPVCLLATGYAQWFDLLRSYFASFSEPERDAIFGGTAIEVYGL